MTYSLRDIWICPILEVLLTNIWSTASRFAQLMTKTSSYTYCWSLTVFIYVLLTKPLPTVFNHIECILCSILPLCSIPSLVILKVESLILAKGWNIWDHSNYTPPFCARVDQPISPSHFVCFPFTEPELYTFFWAHMATVPWGAIRWIWRKLNSIRNTNSTFKWPWRHNNIYIINISIPPLNNILVK